MTLTLTTVTEHYARTSSGKSWQAKPYDTTTDVLPWHDGGEQFHENATGKESRAFFRELGASERAEKSYTLVGNIVTKLTSISPDNDVKVVRRFVISEN